MKCPRCQEATNPKTVNGIVVDQCSKCYGIWFDQDEMRKLKDAQDSDLDWMNFELWKNKEKYKVDRKKIVCPKCNVPLIGVNYDYTNVEVHFCLTCKGMWLDKNQFKQIIDALEKETLNMTFSEYVKASIHEAQQFFEEPEHPITDWRDLMTVMRLAQYRLFTEHPKALDEMLFLEEAAHGIPGMG
ncbi:MAG: zf-TFIIB domain-containing protein [Thermoleophilia bacterium]